MPLFIYFFLVLFLCIKTLLLSPYFYNEPSAGKVKTIVVILYNCCLAIFSSILKQVVKRQKLILDNLVEMNLSLLENL